MSFLFILLRQDEVSGKSYMRYRSIYCSTVHENIINLIIIIYSYKLLKKLKKKGKKILS